MIPNIVKSFLVEQRAGQGCYCLAINSDLIVVECFGDPQLIGIQSPAIDSSIFDFLPILMTETFESDFEIPFFNLNESHVCNIYFIKQETVNYVILVDRSEIFQVTQKYQQFAHDDNISKNKFKRLAEDLEVAKSKLNQSNQEKAVLIAMLSHELGTPLTSILGYSELLLASGSNNTKELKVIHRNAIHLKHMIENTLLFGRSEAGGFQHQLDQISVIDLFDELISTLKPAAISKNLQLMTCDFDNQTINIDTTRTKQILINLINNAIKYTNEGSVQLLFSATKEHYIFSIIDTGLGVAKELQETIFNPWERIEENAEQGSGIGLYISQKLAQAIGGELKLLYSTKQDGSVFQLIIPITELTVKEIPDQKEDIKANCFGKSLLIIDDDYDILLLIEAILQPYGLKIYTALDLKNSNKILLNEKIDLVLTDYNLGTNTASSIIELIKDMNLAIPILLMTSMPTEIIKSSYKTLGFCDVITKPLSHSNLLSTINKNLKT
jgi:signal transduction histidine kinase/CheY-like chemotaxis protein